MTTQSRFAEPLPAGTPLTRNRVDLHCHTNRSDGVLPPLELYGSMAEWGLRVAAITDHDTLAGYRELDGAGLGREHSPRGPILVPGVEINSIADDELVRQGVHLEEGELHVLGFGMDPDDAAFEAHLARQRGGRRTRLLLIVDALRALGKPIDDEIAEVLASEEALGRPHIARALVRAGHVATVQDAFDQWIDRNGPAYVPRQGLRTREAIDAIRSAGGLPVLAHYPAAPEQRQLIGLLAGWGLAGLEVHYRRFVDETVERVSDVCREFGLLPTGGSDYHGDGMTYAEAQETTRVPEEVGEGLLAAVAVAGPASRSVAAG